MEADDAYLMARRAVINGQTIRRDDPQVLHVPAGARCPLCDERTGHTHPVSLPTAPARVQPEKEETRAFDTFAEQWEGV